jgi:hypothetical protein
MGASQCRCRRAGRQDRVHRMGFVATRPAIRGNAACGLNRIVRRNTLNPRSLREASRRWPDSRPVFWKPIAQKWHSMPTPLSGQGCADLHLGQWRAAKRPDRFLQTDQTIIKSPLADGAGHTFTRRAVLVDAHAGKIDHSQFAVRNSCEQSIPDAGFTPANKTGVAGCRRSAVFGNFSPCSA